MSRDYGKILTSIWHSQRFRSISDDGRLLFFALCTTPHAAYARDLRGNLGEFDINETYLAVDLGWPEPRLLRAKADIVASGLLGMVVSCLSDRVKSPAARGHMPVDVVNEVHARDGSKCVYCGTTTGPFHLDHVRPWSRGGGHTADNLAVACVVCNRAKRNRTPEEMGWVLGLVLK